MLTTEDMKNLLSKPEDDYILPEDTMLSVDKAQGESDVLGQKLLTSEDLNKSIRIGEEDVQEQVDSSLRAEELITSNRIGEEVDTSLNTTLGASTKDNPDDEAALGSGNFRDDTSTMKITRGIEEENNNFL